MAKKPMPKYGIIGILSAILAHINIFQQNKVYPIITIELHNISLLFLVQYHVKCGF